MKTSKTIIYVVALLITAALVSCTNKTNKEKPDQEYVLEDDTSNYDSGPEVFCNFMSSEEWPQDAFFADMVEAYNSFVILNGMRSVLDAWERFGASETALESLQYVDLDKIASEDLKAKFAHCLELGRQLFSRKYDDIDTAILARFGNSLYDLDSTITVRFHSTKYANLSAEEYWNAMDFVGQSQDLFGRINNEIDIDSPEAESNIALILEGIKNETDFDKKCAYAMQYAHYVEFYGIDVDVIEGLLDDGRYSPYLFFLWRVWRCGVQLLSPDNYGASTWSPIPNKLYNEKRRLVAETTLRHIVSHRDDAIAINQYLMTASLPNIMRFGEFPTGNESFTELIYLGF